MRRRRNRSVSIGGAMATAPGRRKPPFWAHNRRGNELYLSSYHLAPGNLRHCVGAVRAFKAIVCNVGRGQSARPEMFRP
jgi:hypothetical protein